MHIDATDCTTTLPSLTDLAETGDNGCDTAVKAIFIEFIKLCQCIEGILSLVKIGQKAPYELFARWWQTMEDWKSQMDTNLARTEKGATNDMDSKIMSFYKIVLQLVYKYFTAF